MNLGLVGRKVGMTRTFTDDDDLTPVTVLEIGDNCMMQIRTSETDGCTAVQVTFGTRRVSRVTKPPAGHLAKAGAEAGEVTKKLRVDAARAAEFQPGANIGVDLFEVGQKINIQGMTTGKGYTDIIKRYNLSSGRAPHGNSHSYNVPGSIDMAQDPGRVLLGKHMTGYMDDVTRTAQDLGTTEIDAERKLLLVKGTTPSAKGGQVIATSAVEARAEKA